MPPKSFYEITPQAYLFGKTDETLEEKVRQWALFELLSTYGICIKNIEIERQVKVGTRNLRADIVISRESVPYVVIECKKWDEKKHSRGMDQALSYADANSIKAKYAVYTNGDVWQVKRKLNDNWVDIPDLPKRVDGEYRIELDELLTSVNEFMPAFYWYNESVPASSANTYFSSLQVLFNGSTYPLNILDNNLLCGTDNLLRVICAKGDHPGYSHEKMVAACKSYCTFFDNRMGQRGEGEFINNGNLRELTSLFLNKFGRLVEDTRGLHSDEVLCIRFITALFNYLKTQIRAEKKADFYPNVPIALSGAFQDLAGFLFQVHLGTNFPDPVLAINCSDVRKLCADSWEQFKANH